MAQYKAKAEQAFETKFNAALKARDFGAVEKVMNQYGCYLELIDPQVMLTRDQLIDHAVKTTLLKEEN